MPSHKVGRVTAAIRRLASHTLQHRMHDPRLSMASITDIELSRDLSRCRIGVSVLGNDAQKRTTFRAIQDATAFIQRNVAAGLRTRVTPKLRFYLDQSLEKAERINRLLDQTAREGGRLPPLEPEDAELDDAEPEGEGESP